MNHHWAEPDEGADGQGLVCPDERGDFMATRKQIAARAALCMLAAAAGAPALAQQRITVAWYGGNWGDAT